MTALDIAHPDTFPSRRDEDWKYTDVRRWLRAVPPPSPELPEGEPAGGPFKGLTPNEVLVANGRFNWWGEDDMTPGVEVFLAEEAHPPAMADAMPMGGMAAARAMGPVQIFKVTAGEPQVLSLRLMSRATETGHFARVGVVIEEGAAATLLESHEGAGDGYLSNHLIEIIVRAGARVERIVVAEEAATAVAITSAEVHLEAGAAFSQTVLTVGAKLQRIETRLKHPGEGSAVRIDGAYLLAGRRHADLTSEVDHTGPNGLTDQLTKGVVRDEARGVFQGRIIVRQGADGTDARMGHHALITSERGEVDAKPELEIYADDVSCAHGNTVGALDESALFYMQQRGLPADEARALLTEAFLMEVVDRIGHEGARERCREWLAAKLTPLPEGEGAAHREAVGG